MTIKDIAKLSGYGIGTVSRVINKQPGVSEKAREKILKIIEESNFEPNGNARKLKRCGGNTVTIIMKGRHNSFFMEILDRITLLLSELDEVVSCQIIDEDGDEVAEALKFVRDKTSKAIIFLGANLALFDERMNELDIPCVVATTSAKELAFDNVSSVCVDDETATSSPSSSII